MEKNFKSIYLVCLDQQNDMNYVLARNPSLKKARHAAEKAKTRLPNDEVYITVEKVLKENPSTTHSGLGLGLGAGYTANLGSKKCVCGHKKGGCVSNLSCRCSAISLCKQMDTEESPFLMLTSSSLDDDELEEVEINIVRVSRNLVEVLIPDWADNSIGLSANDFPREVLTSLEPGVVVTAKINIDADSENDLILKDIKLAYEEDELEHNEEFEDDEGYEFEDDEDDEDYEFEDDEDDEFEDDEDYDEFDYEENPEKITSEPEMGAISMGWDSTPQEKALEFDEEDEFEEDEETSDI